MKKSMTKIMAVGISMVMLAGCGSSGTAGTAAQTTAAEADTPAADSQAPDSKAPDSKSAADTQAADSQAASDWEWERDIEIVCAYDVGSGTDTTLRALCPLVEKKLGVNIIINNVSGGSGLTGLEYFYQQPADGYTYAMLTPTHVIKGVSKEASFDVENEIVPVCCTVQDSNIIFANPKLPYKDWEGLVEYAKANPGMPTLTLQSVTGIDALSAQQLFQEAGIDITLVASDGAEAYSMVIGGHADLTLGSPCDGQQYVEAGQVNPIITINTERSTVLPDVPCSADFGLTADLGPWRSIMARKGTPQAAIDSLEAAFEEVMDNEQAWAEWKEVNGLNDRDGQFTQAEMSQVWTDYFSTVGDILDAVNSGK